MVQTWHTFKKFSFPFPNPLHCKRGWHVPNRIAAFVSENSPPLSGIVSSKTTRSHSWGEMLFRGMLCYHSSYVVFRESFICGDFTQPAVFFDAYATAAFSEDSTLKWPNVLSDETKEGTDDPRFLDLFPGRWPYFWYATYGDRIPSHLETYLVLLETCWGWMKSGGRSGHRVYVRQGWEDQTRLT